MTSAGIPTGPGVADWEPPLSLDELLATQAINVKDDSYGALGDDSTDDTAAFVAAILDVPAIGGTIFAPAGTYLLSAFLELPSYITVLGAGRGRTILKVKAASSIATGLLRAINRDSVLIQDLTIDCNAANTTSLGSDTQQQAVYVVTSTVAGTANFALRRVHIKNCERVGFYATNSSTANTHEIELDDVDIDDCGRQGALIVRPSRLRGRVRARRCGTDGNSTDQIQVGLNATDGGSNIELDAEAHDGGRNGITFLGVTDFRFRAYATGNGVAAAVAAQGHGLVISEGCRDFVGRARCKGNYALNVTIDPRTAGAATLKDCEGIIEAEVSGSVTSHGFYAQYAKGFLAHVVSRNNADDGIKLVSCKDALIYGTARGNTDRGVSIVDGSGGGSGPGGKNVIRVHTVGNGTDAIQDTGTTASDTTGSTTG
jgi:hypothetical protein